MNALWLFVLTGIGVAIWMSAIGRLVTERGEELADLEKRARSLRTGLTRDQDTLAEIDRTLADERRDIEDLDTSIATLTTEIKALADRPRPLVRVLNGSADPSARNWIVRTADAEGDVRLFILAAREAKDAIARVAATAPDRTIVGATPFKDWRRTMQDGGEAVPQGDHDRADLPMRRAQG